MGIDPVTGGIIASGVGAAVGGLFGSSKNESTSSTTAQPWSAQAPYLKYGMQDTAYQYAKARGTPYYGGDLYANLDPRSITGLNGLYGYAGGQGISGANAITGAGQPLLGAGGDLQGAYRNLTGFNPQDPTGANIDAAGRYASNPYMDGIIDAASRDISRNLNENELPSLNRQASATGNINSNRTGIAEGILRRGAEDRIGDISAGVRGDAYASGLNLAEQARSTNQSDWLNSQVQGGSLADRTFARGLDATQQGTNLGYGAYDKMVGVGGLYQADQQGDLTQGFDQWKGQDERSWDLLNRYWQMVGSGQWGGSQTNTTPTSIGGFQGALQGALGGASAGAGLYGSFNNILNSGAPSAGTYNMGTAPFGGLY